MKKTLLSLLAIVGLSAAAHAQVLLSVDFNAQFYNQTEPGFTGLPFTTSYPVAVGAYTVNLTSNQSLGTGSSPTNPVADAQLWKDFVVTDNFGTITLTISGLTAGESYTFEAWSWRDGLATPQNVTYTPINGTGGIADIASYTAAAPTSLSDSSVDMALTANGSGEIVLTVTAGTYNGTIINGFQVSAVPEPATTALFTIGAAGMLGMLRRRR
jgi:hypothetical protein